MPMLLGHSPFSRTKPSAGSQVDWGHPLAQGLRGLWPLNEGGGLNTLDVSFGRRGTFSATNPVWKSGSFGNQGLSFAANEFVTLGNPGSQTSTSHSLLVWVFLNTNTSANNIRGIFAHGQFGGDANGDSRIIIRSSSGDKLEFQVSTSTSSTGCQDTVAAPLGVWMQCVGTFDQATLKCTYYRNGVSISSATQTGVYTDNSHAWMLGAYPNATTNTNVDGTIDHAALWGRCLSAEEVRWLYNEPFAMLRSPSLRYWDFLNADGTTFIMNASLPHPQRQMDSPADAIMRAGGRRNLAN